jgi:hypothetical protein
VLNSILTREQVNRDVGGSVILHWRPDQVKETIIPIPSEAKQTQIQQKSHRVLIFTLLTSDTMVKYL